MAEIYVPSPLTEDDLAVWEAELDDPGYVAMLAKTADFEAGVETATFMDNLYNEEKDQIEHIEELALAASVPGITQEKFDSLYAGTVKGADFLHSSVDFADNETEKLINQYRNVAEELPAEIPEILEEEKPEKDKNGLINPEYYNPDLSSEYDNYYDNARTEKRLNSELMSDERSDFPNSNFVSESDIKEQKQSADRESATTMTTHIPATLKGNPDVERVEIFKICAEREKEYRKSVFETCKAIGFEKDRQKRFDMIRALNVCMQSNEKLLQQSVAAVREETIALEKGLPKEQRDNLLNSTNRILLNNASLGKVTTSHIQKMPFKPALSIIQIAGVIFRYVQKEDIKVLQKDSFKLHKTYDKIAAKIENEKKNRKSLLKSLFSMDKDNNASKIRKLEIRLNAVKKAMTIKDNMILHDYQSINKSYQKAIERQRFILSLKNKDEPVTDTVDKRIADAEKKIRENTRKADEFVRNNISFSRENIHDTFSK